MFSGVMADLKTFSIFKCLRYLPLTTVYLMPKKYIKSNIFAIFMTSKNLPSMQLWGGCHQKYKKSQITTF